MRGACVWLVPELSGGIRSYADALWPEMLRAAAEGGWELGRHDRGPVRSPVDVERTAAALAAFRPDLIHVQHEFGLFGSKIVPFYRFPGLVSALRRALPRTRIVATAHTVLDGRSRIDWRGRGAAAPALWLLDRVALPALRPSWTSGTWGRLDGVVVHSRLQRGAVLDSGCPRVEAIPHYVPSAPRGERAAGAEAPEPVLLVFGYFSPEKGQDVVIRALARLRRPARLVCAGGARRPEDRRYLRRCESLARELGLEGRVSVTGFVPPERVDALYSSASLVVAPFRSTSGSGSLAQALARGAPVLASDLPLNRELDERVPGCLALFRGGDPADCARAIDALLADPALRQRLSEGARRYAARFAPDEVARRHIEFYGGLA